MLVMEMHCLHYSNSVLTHVRTNVAVLSLEFLQLKDTKREGGKIGDSISEMFKSICQRIQHNPISLLRVASAFAVCSG